MGVHSFYLALLTRHLRTAVAGLAAACVVAITAIPSAHGQTSFDHFKTGYPLTGSHRTAECESCHVGGIFKGTPRQCYNCHNSTAFRRAQGESVNHPKSTNRC